MSVGERGREGCHELCIVLPYYKHTRITLLCLELHCPVLPYLELPCTALHCTALRCLASRCIPFKNRNHDTNSDTHTHAHAHLRLTLWQKTRWTGRKKAKVKEKISNLQSLEQSFQSVQPHRHRGRDLRAGNGHAIFRTVTVLSRQIPLDR